MEVDQELPGDGSRFYFYFYFFYSIPGCYLFPSDQRIDPSASSIFCFFFKLAVGRQITGVVVSQFFFFFVFFSCFKRSVGCSFRRVERRRWRAILKGGGGEGRQLCQCRRRDVPASRSISPADGAVLASSRSVALAPDSGRHF